MKQPNPAFFRPVTEALDTTIFCAHVLPTDTPCASPPLRGHTLCYHHQPSRIARPTRRAARTAENRARRNFSVPHPTTPSGLQQALDIIIQALAANRITPRRAGQLLATLQQTSISLKAILNPQEPPLLDTPPPSRIQWCA